MLTIEEVIEHCDKTVNLLERAGQTNNKQYEEHLLVRDCLRELSRRRVEELFRKTDEKSIRDKAIDDVLEILKRYNVQFNCDANYEILQLKECGSND